MPGVGRASRAPHACCQLLCNAASNRRLAADPGIVGVMSQHKWTVGLLRCARARALPCSSASIRLASAWQAAMMQQHTACLVPLLFSVHLPPPFCEPQRDAARGQGGCGSNGSRPAPAHVQHARFRAVTKLLPQPCRSAAADSNRQLPVSSRRWASARCASWASTSTAGRRSRCACAQMTSKVDW